jgi:hypothetical protein
MMQISPLELAEQRCGDSRSIRDLGEGQPGCAAGATNIRDRDVRISCVDSEWQRIGVRWMQRARQDQRLDAQRRVGRCEPRQGVGKLCE